MIVISFNYICYSYRLNINFSFSSLHSQDCRNIMFVENIFSWRNNIATPSHYLFLSMNICTRLNTLLYVHGYRIAKDIRFGVEKYQTCVSVPPFLDLWQEI